MPNPTTVRSNLATLLSGGVSRHGSSCDCRYCAGPVPVVPAYVDTRPRVDYTLPNGERIKFIVDHDQPAPDTITYQLAGGRVVTAVRS